jgi:hypothetical protein
LHDEAKGRENKRDARGQDRAMNPKREEKVLFIMMMFFYYGMPSCPCVKDQKV